MLLSGRRQGPSPFRRLATAFEDEKVHRTFSWVLSPLSPEGRGIAGTAHQAAGLRISAMSGAGNSQVQPCMSATVCKVVSL